MDNPGGVVVRKIRAQQAQSQQHGQVQVSLVHQQQPQMHPGNVQVSLVRQEPPQVHQGQVQVSLVRQEQPQVHPGQVQVSLVRQEQPQVHPGQVQVSLVRQEQPQGRPGQVQVSLVRQEQPQGHQRQVQESLVRQQQPQGRPGQVQVSLGRQQQPQGCQRKVQESLVGQQQPQGCQVQQQPQGRQPQPQGHKGQVQVSLVRQQQPQGCQGQVQGSLGRQQQPQGCQGQQQPQGREGQVVQVTQVCQGQAQQAQGLGGQAQVSLVHQQPAQGTLVSEEPVQRSLVRQGQVQVSLGHQGQAPQDLGGQEQGPLVRQPSAQGTLVSGEPAQQSRVGQGTVSHVHEQHAQVALGHEVQVQQALDLTKQVHVAESPRGNERSLSDMITKLKRGEKLTVMNTVFGGIMEANGSTVNNAATPNVQVLQQAGLEIIPIGQNSDHHETVNNAGTSENEPPAPVKGTIKEVLNNVMGKMKAVVTGKQQENDVNPKKKFECLDCYTSYGYIKTFQDHKIKLTCGTISCKEEHDHNYLVEKFSTREEAKSFLYANMSAKIRTKSKKGAKNMRGYCSGLKGACPAKFNWTENLNNEGETEHVVKGCFNHHEECPANKEDTVEEAVNKVQEIGKFNSMEEAVIYMLDNELDSAFKINQRRTKKGLEYRYYICRRSGHYTSKTRESKKIGCKSYISLKEGQEGQIVMMTNPEHPHEIGELSVVSSKKREAVRTSLNFGVSTKEIYRQIVLSHSNQDTTQSNSELSKFAYIDEDSNPEFKKVTRDFIRQQDRSHGTKTHLNQSEMKNVYKLLEEEAWRGFQSRRLFRDQPDEDGVQIKEIATLNNSPMVVYMSQSQKEIFRKNPKVLMVDTTHNSNDSGLLLMTVMAIDERGAGVPILHALIESESKDNVTPVLEILKKEEPEACSKVTTITSDMNHAFLNSFNEVLDQDLHWVPCGWHLDRAWRLNLGGPHARALKKEILSLRLESDQKEFEMRYEMLHRYCMIEGNESEKKGWRYFATNYGYSGEKAKPHEWARAYNAGSLAHNLHIERFHKTIKTDVNPSCRIDQTMVAIQEHSALTAYERKLVESQQSGIRKTSAQKDYFASHCTMEGYTITEGVGEKEGTFVIKADHNEGYTLSNKNRRFY